MHTKMKQDLKTKFSDSSRGVYLFGTTPPKDGIEDATVSSIADKLLERLAHVEFDGLIVYDIQDESSRIDKPRPFPFMRTLDPRAYSKLLREKSEKPVITYKSVSQRDEAAFTEWLDEAWNKYGVRDTVLVGSPSSEGEIQLSLNDAYKVIEKHPAQYQLGGVTIAERHASKRNEHERLISKIDQGCDFFVSQAVYDAQATIDMLSSYARKCREEGITPKRVILTFTPCGSTKTLEFMEWLGISVPEATRFRIMDAHNPLQESIRICRNNLEQILEAVMPLDIPIGLNIESLTNRKEEIDASIRLFKLLKSVVDLKLAEAAL
ncbi:putative orphan protein [Oceanospirillum sp. MED92]|uniref:Methylenetetrahydrofolate reductase n=2 Tax=Neptuniibacter caesariensis TaxID=207954 RepID=A0A7U8C5H1_NEPCE|nr:putative orphan protein [Oceanospirillum sp. MED92] [Neptuniibacter caesariensis]